jgi:hypothetical protein
MYFIPIILKAKYDVGRFYISMDIPPIVQLLNRVQQLYRYFTYNRKWPIKLTFLAHIIQVLAEKIRNYNAFLCLYKIAFYLGNPLHICNFFKNLKFIRDGGVIVFLLDFNAGKIVG